MRQATVASMATGSPTPFNHNDISGRPISRHHMRTQVSRPNLKRGTAHVSKPAVNGSALPSSWKFTLGDSSDDEAPPPPPKFSAGTKAFLGDDASIIGTSSPSQKDEGHKVEAVNDVVKAVKRRSPLPLRSQRERTASPASVRSGSPHIVRLSASLAAPSSLRKSASTRSDEPSPPAPNQHDHVTPAPRARSYTINSPATRPGNVSSEMYESYSTKPSSVDSDSHAKPTPASGERSRIHETALQIGNLSIHKAKGDETGLQGSIRVKRKLPTGRYLSGPARRGMIRRQSEENQSPIYESTPLSDQKLVSAEVGKGSHLKEVASTPPIAGHGPGSVPESLQQEAPAHVRFQSQTNVITGSPIRTAREPQKSLLDTVESKPKNRSLSIDEPSLKKRVQPIFKVPPLPLLHSRYDQENDPPPTFKRNKANGSVFSHSTKYGLMSDEKKLLNTPATATPQRPALAARSQNTPHRPAPAPPKMTVLETATAPAGAASASQARKKRNYISVNGKLFTRMDCIGRGGSSKVYRVMAENYKVFALKRVTLEDQDELAIRGYKGEIDLLRKLENVDRVVRLFDWEINLERQTLSVLMEMGETDLNRVLTLRLNAEDGKFDITFARYFWKEMLECVQAVHQHEIVHSDLKPANFLLLQGKLKLIDFGIANSIGNDTVNVHREQHIGTPNYMSPEALIDSNTGSGLPSTAGKVMKLGKPSDVWSMGCILYQITYGKPPFAHIANQMQRIMAIPNPNHTIDFPDTGVGGVSVSTGLVRTLKACLNRNPFQRPTVEQLLAQSDPFLYPDTAIRDTVPVGQELIARLQHNIIKHIREKGMPEEAELATWPARFFTSIKAAVEEGRA